VTEAGFYNLLVEGICESFESGIEVDYIELKVFQPNINAFYTFCEGASLSLDLESSGVDEILWEDGSTDFERTFSEAGNYGFELFNFCQDSSYAFTVTFIDCISDMIYVPNTFTPNDDGTNDVFSIELPSDWVNPTLDVAIFNRWGEEMFYSEAVDFSWDGRFKDQPLNPEVYVYSINIEVEIDQKIKKILLQGDITIYK